MSKVQFGKASGFNKHKKLLYVEILNDKVDNGS